MPATTRTVIDVTGTRYTIPLEAEALYRQVPGEAWEIGRRIDEVQQTQHGAVLALIFDHHLDALGQPLGARWERLDNAQVARLNEVIGLDLSSLLPSG